MARSCRQQGHQIITSLCAVTILRRNSVETISINPCTVVCRPNSAPPTKACVQINYVKHSGVNNCEIRHENDVYFLRQVLTSTA
jgi:hypothetical protein